MAIEQHFSKSFNNRVESIFPLCHSKFFFAYLCHNIAPYTLLRNVCFIKMRVKTCAAEVITPFYFSSYYKGVDFSIKMHFKTGLVLYKRNNFGIVGTANTYANACFYFFQLFRIAHFLWSNPIICAILWVLTNYTEII